MERDQNNLAEKERLQGQYRERHVNGRSRIKNITDEVEGYREHDAIESILPKTDWETYMASARSSSSAQQRDGSPQKTVRKPVRGSAGDFAREFEDSDRRTRRSGKSAGKRSKDRASMRSTGDYAKRGSAAGSRKASSGRRSDQRSSGQKRASGKQAKSQSFRGIKIAAVFFVLVIIAASVYMIGTYGKGSSINKQGQKYYADMEYEQARDCFLEALEKDELNGEYLVNLGMTYIALGDYENALLNFEKAVENTKSNDIVEMAKRGCGIVYLSSGHYSMAVDQFKEALAYAGERREANEIDILYYLAESQSRMGNMSDAAQTYTEIIEKGKDANAYMLRGLTYHDGGDYANAEKDLETALGMSKRNYKLYLALYEVLIAQDKADEAAAILDDALNLGGKSGEDYSNRGIVYMYMGDYASAAEAFHTALDKGYNGAYLGLAESLMRQEDYANATLEYENYIRQDMTCAKAYNQYGLCLMKSERYNEAVSAFQAGIALNDRLSDRELMYNLAVAYEKLHDWASAYAQMTAFMEKYPEDAQGQKEFAFLQSMELENQTAESSGDADDDTQSETGE